MKKSSKSENKIEYELCSGVKAIGGRTYKFLSPGRSGVPDRVVCLPGGRVIFAELKTETGKLSDQQKFRIAELRAMQQEVFVLYGESDVLKFLDYAKELSRGAV